MSCLNPDGSATTGAGVCWIPSGWDRPELYADPYTGRIYLAANLTYGPGPTASGYLLYSDDFGRKRWSVGQALQGPIPYRMTSLKPRPGSQYGTFFMFHCWDINPVLGSGVERSSRSAFRAPGAQLTSSARPPGRRRLLWRLLGRGEGF